MLKYPINKEEGEEESEVGVFFLANAPFDLGRILLYESEYYCKSLITILIIISFILRRNIKAIWDKWSAPTTPADMSTQTLGRYLTLHGVEVPETREEVVGELIRLIECGGKDGKD